jgi:hypothetical protein
MTLVLRADKGSPLTIAEGDGNLTYLDGRIDTVAALVGKTIDSITTSAAAITFNLSDSSSVVVPLPTLQLNPRGEWMPSTDYFYGDLVNVRGLGLFLVAVTHTSASSFDPDATDDTTANNALYQLWAPLRDVHYDIAISVTGPIPGDQSVLAQVIIPRALQMSAGLSGAVARLATATQATSLQFNLEQNGGQIGYVSFFADTDVNTDGSQDGTITFSADVTFAAGDIFVVLAPNASDVPLTDGTQAADFAMTIPATRLDI